MNLKYALAIAALIPVGIIAQQSEAATITVPVGQDYILHQNEAAYFDVTDFTGFSLSFTNAEWWSGGSILWTTDKTLTKPWEAKHLDTWGVSIVNPTDIFAWTYDTVQDFGRFFVVGTYGKSFVHANVTGVDAPAPVPLPGAVALMLGALGSLLAVGKRKALQARVAAFMDMSGTAWVGHDGRYKALTDEGRLAERDAEYSKAVFT